MSLGSRRARAIAWGLGALPAAWLAWQLWLAFHGEPHALGSNPVKRLEHRTGAWTIRFLTLTLLVSPLRWATGWNWLVRYRRIAGLLTFGYATAHLATFAILDLELQLGEVATEIAKRPYLVVGFTAWLLLLPLALTSTTVAIRRLGGHRWQRLHRLVYAVAALGTVHFWWSQKKDKTDPLIWGTILMTLLLVRLVRSRRAAGSGPTPSARRPRRSARRSAADDARTVAE